VSGREDRLLLAYRRLLDKISHLEQSLNFLKDEATTLGLVLQEVIAAQRQVPVNPAPAPPKRRVRVRRKEEVKRKEVPEGGE